MVKLLADVTEQLIQCPEKKHKRKKTYSGKEKSHTQKVEMIMHDKGKMMFISKSQNMIVVFVRKRYLYS
jgi:hypothetical protein